MNQEHTSHEQHASIFHNIIENDQIFMKTKFLQVIVTWNMCTMSNMTSIKNKHE